MATDTPKQEAWAKGLGSLHFQSSKSKFGTCLILLIHALFQHSLNIWLEFTFYKKWLSKDNYFIWIIFTITREWFHIWAEWDLSEDILLHWETVTKYWCCWTIGFLLLKELVYGYEEMNSHRNGISIYYTLW